MGGPILIVVFQAIVAVAVAMMFLFRRARGTAEVIEQYPALTQMRRTTTAWRVAGILLAAVVGRYMLSSGGVAPALAPAVAAGVIIVGVLLGQWQTYRAAQTPGTAALERRSLRSYVPTWLVAILLVAGSLMAAGFVLGISLGSVPPEPGSGSVLGASLNWTCQVHTSEGMQTIGGGIGPFPGSYYSLPMLISFIPPLLMAIGGLWMVVARPRNGADEDLVYVDDALRTQTAEGILASIALMLGVSMVGVGGFGWRGVSQTSEANGWFENAQGVMEQIPGCDLGGLYSVGDVVFPLVLFTGLMVTFVALASLIWSTVKAQK